MFLRINTLNDLFYTVNNVNTNSLTTNYSKIYRKMKFTLIVTRIFYFNDSNLQFTYSYKTSWTFLLIILAIKQELLDKSYKSQTSDWLITFNWPEIVYNFTLFHSKIMSYDCRSYVNYLIIWCSPHRLISKINITYLQFKELQF